MEELLPHYERELALLRRAMQTFALRYPRIAARLAISGERSEDPHVERMIQSFALLAARLDAKLEDDYPEFTEALLELLYPQYLRPIPSCSIARFDVGGLFDRLTGPATIERGTELVTKVQECRFRTTYDVTLAPLLITDARYTFTASAPASISLPPDTGGIVSITFASTVATANLHEAATGTVRVHLDGQAEIVAALSDALLLRVSTAYFEADGRGQWKRLARVPLAAAGFDASEALLDGEGDTSASFRLLEEYFAFPAKFDFVDIDFATLMREAGSCRRITLHLPVERVHKDSWAAQRLASLGAANIRLFCTPVVNLFRRKAEPIKLDRTTVKYPVLPRLQKSRSEPGFEVYSIDAVYPSKQPASGATVFPPFHGLMHGSSTGLSGPYWIARRDERIAQHNPGYETVLALVSLDGLPAVSDAEQLGVDLTCTNRNIPSTLPFGAPGGDLLSEGGMLPCPIALLRRPTESRRLPRGDGALWRLIEHLTPHALQISTEGLEGLKRLFRQYAALSVPQARHIDGITYLDRRPKMLWIVKEPRPSFVRGIEITMTVDEQAFAGSSVSTFTGVMDRFFAPYMPASSFVQLVVISANTGAEIHRCQPRQGTSALL